MSLADMHLQDALVGIRFVWLVTECWLLDYKQNTELILRKRLLSDYLSLWVTEICVRVKDILLF